MLDEVIEKHRGKYEYDCIVPFSGGKDSSYTMYYLMKEYKIKPLVVRFNHGFIRKKLSDLYDINHDTLVSAMEHGVPQMRKRRCRRS